MPGQQVAFVLVWGGGGVHWNFTLRGEWENAGSRYLGGSVLASILK